MYFKRLEDLRADNDKTLAYIGKVLDCNPEVYRRYEKGIREIPAWALIKLAAYYHTSVDYLLGLTDNPRPYENAADISTGHAKAACFKPNRGSKPGQD